MSERNPYLAAEVRAVTKSYDPFYGVEGYNAPDKPEEPWRRYLRTYVFRQVVSGPTGRPKNKK